MFLRYTYKYNHNLIFIKSSLHLSSTHELYRTDQVHCFYIDYMWIVWACELPRVGEQISSFVTVWERVREPVTTGWSRAEPPESRNQRCYLLHSVTSRQRHHYCVADMLRAWPSTLHIVHVSFFDIIVGLCKRLTYLKKENTSSSRHRVGLLTHTSMSLLLVESDSVVIASSITATCRWHHLFKCFETELQMITVTVMV